MQKDVRTKLVDSCMEELQMISEAISSINTLLVKRNLYAQSKECLDLKESINLVIFECVETLGNCKTMNASRLVNGTFRKSSIPAALVVWALIKSNYTLFDLPSLMY